jgi:hypothetical protein
MTNAIVQTWLRSARYSLCLAMLADPTVAALACIAIGIVCACAIVKARTLAAVFHFNFAVDAGVTGPALARVRSLSGVGTRSAVVAGLVICAKV